MDSSSFISSSVKDSSEMLEGVLAVLFSNISSSSSFCDGKARVTFGFGGGGVVGQDGGRGISCGGGVGC